MLKKSQRITRNEYKKALDNTKAFYTSFFTLSHKKALENNDKISIVVSKSVAKSAVQRNKLRRKMATLIQKKIKNIENKGVFIFFMKKGSNTASINELENSINEVMKKLK